MSSVHSLSTMVHKRECLFKIIVIGDISTGKTSLIQRFIHNSMSGNYKPTLGVDFATKLVQFEDTLVRLQFWDISDKFFPRESCQERFANMTRVYYRDSHGAIVVYDCKRSDTLTGAYRWKKDLDSKLILDNGQPIPAILVANKCDLENSLNTEMLDDYARQGAFRAGFKLSAKTGEGIESAMDFLLRSVVSAERDGLYFMPMLQRDQNLHRLSAQELEQKKKRMSRKNYFQNACC
ncbi:hypothetical protein niasHT_026678 [Heterodera trifolii]|uniref:Ras-related protein Rab n=1 Tax=Heterodera trifolii TaxID=157864 RepID=A0ABD2JSX4_9BILA